MKTSTLIRHILVCSCLFLAANTIFAQGTAFTYQGRLNDGANPANGLYDFQFALYDDVSDPLAAITGTNALTAVPVSNGLFTVTLDFSTPVLADLNGQEVWLGIAVRSNSVANPAYVALSPRQLLTPTPYAITAENLGANSVISGLQIQDGTISGGKLVPGAIGATQIASNSITASQLAPGAAAANLGSNNIGGIPSTGIVLSEKQINSSLLNAGFVSLGGQLHIANESWASIPSGPPATGATNPGRYNHKAVWTGSLMLIIGGTPDYSGIRYNPSANTWSLMNKAGYPTVGDSVEVAWTGTVLVVYDAYQRIGGRYNPATDTWSSMSTTGAPVSRKGESSTWTGTYLVVWGGHSDDAGYFNSGARYNPSTDTWTPNSSVNAPSGRDNPTAVWSGTEAIFYGGKQYVDELIGSPPFQGHFVGFDGMNDGGRYNPSTDTWAPVATNGARFNHTAIWTGSRMILYGGSADDGITSFANSSTTGFDLASPSGVSYNPANNTWTSLSTSGAPAGRTSHAAVWDGTHMLVWGGEGTNGFLADGANYTPASDTWSSVAAVAATPRIDHTAVWTGTQMIIWGGEDANSFALSDGSRYTLSGNTWSATSIPPATGEPSPRGSATYVWTGSKLITWGGINGSTTLRSGGIYTPGIGWSNTPDAGAPSARYQHTAVWTGTDMLVWGGTGGTASPVNTGARYNLASNQWFPISTINAPRARANHCAVWTGTYMFVYGGYDYTNLLFPIPLNTAGLYNPASNTWTLITNPLSVTPARILSSAIWSGSNVLIFGGFFTTGGFSPVLSFSPVGFTYDPAADAWDYIIADALTAGRRSHTALWDGSEMLIWGGYTINGPTNSGARYNPSTGIWTRMTTSNAPLARLDHSGVWADSKGQMIIWGGTDNANYFSDGSSYDVASDTWTTLTNNFPFLGRSTHGGVWTGTNMIVLDGTGSGPTNFNDGAVYTPAMNYYFYKKP